MRTIQHRGADLQITALLARSPRGRIFTIKTQTTYQPKKEKKKKDYSSALHISAKTEHKTKWPF